MHHVTVYSPDGETFEVPKSRAFNLLAQGWTLVKPEAKKVEEAPRIWQRKAKHVEHTVEAVVEVDDSSTKDVALD